MSEVHEGGEIAATPEEVWTLVGDFGGLVEALGVPVELEGEGIGTLRTIKVGTDLVVERLEERDEDTMRLSYSLIQAGPLPVRNYFATMQLTPTGDGHCTLAWTGTFEPAGVSEDDAVKAVRGVYTGGIAALRRRFAK